MKNDDLNQLDDLLKDWDELTLEQKFDRVKESVLQATEESLTDHDIMEELKNRTVETDFDREQARALVRELSKSRDVMWATPKLNMSNELLGRIFDYDVQEND